MREYLFSLLTRHQRLDAALHDEQKRPAPDFARVQRLKRLKLGVKDRLAELAPA